MNLPVIGMLGCIISNLSGNITHNEFTGNNGSQAGGFHVSVNMTGDITHNEFTENRGSGAGFDIPRSFIGNVTHNKFIGNNGTYGGGFFIHNMTGTVNYNEFIRNSTSRHGGGCTIGTLTGNITHNIFDSNSAQWGGGFELWTSMNTVEVFNNVFFNNTSSGTGNAVVTKHPTHFMNNLFMISDELSEGVSGAHTIWVNSPGVPIP